jgi:peptidoglycan/xylan/chitin deacetylase (PgdA/CDA1 family)
MQISAVTTVALSFDDGPGPATPALLDLLAARGVRATFFFLGRNVERARETAERAAREGHVLGNHTYTHARPGVLDERAFADEIARTDRLLLEVGARAPIPLRLPYGPQENDPRPSWLRALGRRHLHWTADFADWSEPPPDPAELAARLGAQVAAQPEAVIDLHDSSKLFADRRATVEAVRLFLDQVRAQWVTLA